jgi:hypothetical protein
LPGVRGQRLRHSLFPATYILVQVPPLAAPAFGAQARIRRERVLKFAVWVDK